MTNVQPIWPHVQLNLVLPQDVKTGHALMLQKQILQMSNAKLIFQIKNVLLKTEEDAELIQLVKLLTRKLLARQTEMARLVSGILESA